MRHGRLLLSEQDGKVCVGVDSLLRALREVPRLRDVADEVEIAVLRAQVTQVQGQLVRGDIQRKLDHEGGQVVTIDGQTFDWEYRDGQPPLPPPCSPECIETRYDTRGDCDGPLYRCVVSVPGGLGQPKDTVVLLCRSHWRQADKDVVIHPVVSPASGSWAAA